MHHGLLASTIPFDGYARPILFRDGALIGLVVLPGNLVADFQESGLFAGHFFLPNGLRRDAHSPLALDKLYAKPW